MNLQDEEFAAVPAIRAAFRSEMEQLTDDEIRSWNVFHQKRASRRDRGRA